MRQSLQLRMGQQLTMTPQLQQAIKLLQLSNTDLSEFVEGELEKNPLLERDEGEGSIAQEAAIDNMSAYDEAQNIELLESTNNDGFSEEALIDTLSQTETGSLPDKNDDPNDTDYENNWSSASVEDNRNASNSSAESMGSYTGTGGT